MTQCPFCDRFDFTVSGWSADPYGARIVNAGGSSRIPRRQQFNYCPVCGRARYDTPVFYPEFADPSSEDKMKLETKVNNLITALRDWYAHVHMPPGVIEAELISDTAALAYLQRTLKNLEES